MPGGWRARRRGASWETAMNSTGNYGCATGIRANPLQAAVKCGCEPGPRARGWEVKGGVTTMTLSRKDVVATVLTVLVVLTFAATHEGWNVPLVGDSHRWAAAVILL